MKAILNFFRPNTASILSSFTKTIDRLEAVAAREFSLSEKKGAWAAKYQQQSNNHVAEQNRALNAASKLKGVFGL